MIPVFITVRTASTRLPGKCLLPLGDCNVLEHVIRRCKHFEFRPIVCTTENEGDDAIVHIAKSEDVEFYRGHQEPRKRWMECAAWFDLWSFHALDCDDPYFDPLEIERSHSYLIDLGLHCVLPTKISDEYALGLMGTSLSLRVGETKVLPSCDERIPIVRLTLDYEEDYWMLRTLNRLGHDYKTPRANLEMDARHLSIINGFRNREWKERQLAERSL